MRRVVDECSGEQGLQTFIAARKARTDVGQRRGQTNGIATAVQKLRDRLRRREPVPDGAKVFRRAALQGEP